MAKIQLSRVHPSVDEPGVASDIAHIERIGRAFMHILFVHCCAVLLADTSSIGVTRVVVCMAYSFLLQN